MTSTRLLRTASPWIKICGVRDVATALAVADLQPAAVGLNFYPPSVRFVADDVAREIATNLPTTMLSVGVFVNEPLAEVVRRVRHIPLSAVQFHGDESVAFLAEFSQKCPETPVIRAFRRGRLGLQPLAAEWHACQAAGVRIDAVLIDADAGGAYGGTGQTLPWEELRAELDQWDGPPVILAGGLKPENVAEALRTTRPWGVDVASGVESAPGFKDLPAVARFIQAARACGTP